MKFTIIALLFLAGLGSVATAESGAAVLAWAQVLEPIARLRAESDSLYQANEIELTRELQKLDAPYLAALVRLEVGLAKSNNAFGADMARGEQKRISEGRMLNEERVPTLAGLFGQVFTDYYAGWKKVAPPRLAKRQEILVRHMAALVRLQVAYLQSGDNVAARLVMNERHRVSEEHTGSRGVFNVATEWCGTGRTKLGNQASEPVWKAATSDIGFAIVSGVGFLQRSQNPDGSYGDREKGLLTGLSLLCLIATGERKDSPHVGRNMAAAAEWILKNGVENQGGLSPGLLATDRGALAHAICTAALCEYYGMTMDGRFLPTVRQAVAQIVERQKETGGWGSLDAKTRSDLFVTGWHTLTLYAALCAKVDASGVEQALVKATAFAATLKGVKGGYGRNQADDHYGSTGAGILVSLLGKMDRGAMRKGMEWLLDETKNRRPVKFLCDDADIEAWYFHTQACSLFGGVAWTQWKRMFFAEVINAQSVDGSWPRPAGQHDGLQGEDSKAGQIYRTALCLLSMEIYFRQLAIWRG